MMSFHVARPGLRLLLDGGFQVKTILLKDTLSGVAPVLRAFLPHNVPYSQSIGRLFSSSSSSSKKKGSSRQSKQKQVKQAQQQRNASPAAWPQPARLVLPDRKATAPVLGRVPPSSRAAAASTASILRAAKQLQQQHQNQQQAGHIVDVVDAQPSAAEQQQQMQPAAAPPTSSSSGSSRDAAAAAAAINASPWEVVAALPQSSRYSLEQMSDMDILTYLRYLRDTRMGMPSVFELGVAREQGRKGRSQLLRRETLLWHILDLLHPQQQQQQQQADSSGSEAGAAAEPAALGSSFGPSQELQQQQQLFNVQRRVMQQQQSFISDELLQELSQQQLAEAAAAASAACHAAAGATADEVADCLVDYFVFKRAMQLMLLQRQHRQLLQQQQQQQHRLQQQQQEEEEEEEGDWPRGHLSSPNNQQPPPQLLAAADMADVDIWDAFFDADLTDYLEYLQAAAAGAPSVFTTLNPTYSDAAGQPQQQQQQQLERAQQLIAGAAEMLALLPAGMRERPGLLIGGSQLLQVAGMSGGRVEDVVEVLQDFYKLKRLGFRQALQELMDAAGDGSAMERL